MPAHQLRLFPPARPLLRLGETFFRELPRSAGVYLMRDALGTILYVGQSTNLRQRLSSYKNVRPETSPRRIIRLVHAVETISWEVCANATTARLRENELLRTHRPRFNSVNTYPQAYCFIVTRESAAALNVSLVRESPPLDVDNCYGAFKTGCRYGFGSLATLLWISQHRPLSLAAIPHRFLQSRPLREFSLDLGKEHPNNPIPLARLVRGFLNGSDPSLLEQLRASMVEEKPGSFAGVWQKHLFETVEQFYRCGPERNFNLTRARRCSRSWIGKEELDDWAVAGSENFCNL